MFFQKPIIFVFFITIISLLCSSCKVSVNTGGFENGFASDVREEPIPEEYASTLFAYADSVIVDFYEKDIPALREKTHPQFIGMFDEINAKTAMKLLNAKNADISKKEYLGYNMFTAENGDEDLIFASLFYRVPLNNSGNDNITLNIHADMNNCCRLVGFNVEKSFTKSLLGKN